MPSLSTLPSALLAAPQAPRLGACGVRRASRLPISHPPAHACGHDYFPHDRTPGPGCWVRTTRSSSRPSAAPLPARPARRRVPRWAPLTRWPTCASATGGRAGWRSSCSVGLLAVGRLTVVDLRLVHQAAFCRFGHKTNKIRKCTMGRRFWKWCNCCAQPSVPVEGSFMEGLFTCAWREAQGGEVHQHSTALVLALYASCLSPWGRHRDHASQHTTSWCEGCHHVARGAIQGSMASSKALQSTPPPLPRSHCKDPFPCGPSTHDSLAPVMPFPFLQTT